MENREKQQHLDERYIRMARIWGENSYCKRRQVGALLVKEKMIISDGFNGTPSGFENICEDENGKTNLSIQDTDGELLIISQFTLYADCRKGRRPSFTGAGSPEHAKNLYEYVIEQCTPQVKKVAHGEFGAEMIVEIINDGPFTIVLDSADLA